MQYKPSSSSINNDTSHFLNSDNNQTNQDQHGIQHHDIQTQQQQRQLQHHEQLLQRSHKYFIQEREQRLQRNGYRPPPLLALPSETLTGIAAYLAPPSLLALGQVSRSLAELIRDDHTWRVAFLCGWIGVSPNSSPESGVIPGDSSWKTLLLDKSKREDRTWREEYIWRYVMINRWSYSSNPTSTHAPVHSVISGMRLVALGKSSIKISPSNSTSSVVSSAYTSKEQVNELGVNPSNLRDVLPAKNIIAAPTNGASVALLSSSIQYGIVARSQPTLARVGTGFIDAVGGGRAGRRGWPGLGAGWIGNGLNGNPNMQFRPDVVSCDISVEHVAPASVEANPNATTPHVYVIWGTRTGEIVLTHAARALDGFISGGTGARSSTTGAMTVKRSGAGEGHEGTVKDVKWIVGSLSRKKYALTAGVDGRVKLWEVNYDAEEKQVTMRCVWTSSVKERTVSVRAPVRGLGANTGFGQLIDECVRVEGLVVPTIGDCHGKLQVVCVTRTGDIRVWLFDDHDIWTTGIKEVVVPRPRLDGQDAEQELYSEAAMPIALAIDPIDPISMSSSQSNWDARFLVAYQDDSVFYRVTVRLDQVEATPFGNLAFGPISVVDPHFARQGRDQDKAVILVGDRMGCVSVYSWDVAHSIASIEAGSNNADVISPFKSFEAHRDGATVTAIFWDGLVLVTGSARGTTHVFDALTFQHIRSFVAPFKVARGSRRARMGQEGVERDREKMAVRQILVNSVAQGGEVQGPGDVLVVAVGDVVLAWQAGRAAARNPSSPQRRNHGKGRSSPTGSGPSARSVPGATEIKQAVSETQTQLALEKKERVKKEKKERAYREGLERMGLGEMSESEMVDYLMMLSMEEEERREAERQEAAFLQDQVHTEEEGVFEPDFEDDSEAYEGRFTEEWEDDDRAWSSASSSGYASVSSSVTSTPTRQARVGIPISGPATASSSAARNTSMAASPGISSYWANPNAGVDIHAEEFPPIPGSADGSPTSNGGSAMASTSRNVATSDLPARPVVQASPPKGPTPSSSPKSLKGSAWSTPLKAKLSQPAIQQSASSSSAASTTASTSMNAAAGSSSSSAHSVGGGAATAGNLGFGADEEMDEDLRFALELSLVEARSRGEDV